MNGILSHCIVLPSGTHCCTLDMLCASSHRQTLAEMPGRSLDPVWTDSTSYSVQNLYASPYPFPLSSHSVPSALQPTEGRLASQGPEHDRMATLLKGMMGNKWKWQWSGSGLSLLLLPPAHKCQWMKMDPTLFWPEKGLSPSHPASLLLISESCSLSLTPKHHRALFATLAIHCPYPSLIT